MRGARTRPRSEARIYAYSAKRRSGKTCLSWLKFETHERIIPASEAAQRTFLPRIPSDNMNGRIPRYNIAEEVVH
jgi:hypothetical protein